MKRLSMLLIVIAIAMTAIFYASVYKLKNANRDSVIAGGDLEQNQNEVTLYYANNEYIRSGNEDMPKVIPIKRNVKAGAMSIEEAAVRELLKEPKDERISTALAQDINILGVQVNENTAFVNFANQNLNGGTLEESLVISQVVKTLMEFPQVKRVKFLIEGETAETLMGHIDISKPLE